MMSRVIARGLCVAAQEAVGVARLAEYFGYVALQRTAIRAQAVVNVVNTVRPLADDVAWAALTSSVRASRTAVGSLERAARQIATSTGPTREALALRLDHLANVVGAPEKPGSLFRGIGLGARFLFP